MNVTGIVLAGGRATRFGGPKLAALLEGRSMLALAIGALSGVAREILVAGPELPETAEHAGIPHRRPRAEVEVRLVVDAAPFAGPLSALAGALREAHGDVAVVVGGDMPRLVPAVLESMVARLLADPSIEAVLLGAPQDAPAAIGRTDPRRQVLPVAVRVEAASPAARAALVAGDRSLRALLDRLACEEIPARTWLHLDPSAATLLDVDTRADLERVRDRGSGGDLP